MLSLRVAGDYNGDAIVDAADYVIWQKMDGSQSALNTWTANYGRGTGDGSSANSAVPEPMGTITLAVVIYVTVHGRRPSWATADNLQSG
jgi:hypothetical protein